MAGAAYWRRQAVRVAWRHNFSWFLACLARPLVAVALLTAAALLVLRVTRAPTDGAWVGGGLAALGVVAWAATRARRHGIGWLGALARLDEHLRLNNALVAAAAGVGAYPAPGPASDGLRWRPLPTLAPFLAAAAVIALAAFVPVSRDAGSRLPPAEPAAWQDVTRWAEELERSEVAEPSAVERLREQLDELRSRPESDWYAQSSLEAGDALREDAAQSIAALQRQLESAASALAAASESESAADTAPLREQLDRALQGMSSGRLPVDPELARELRNLDLSKVRQLDAQQVRQLRDRLEKGATACATCTGGRTGERLGAAAPGADGPGSGAIARGPGTTPLTRKPLPTDLRSEATEQIRSEDLDRALPGDLLGVRRAEPPAEGIAPGPGGDAGGTAGTGSGGDAVWREELTPRERDVVRRFFQ